MTETLSWQSSTPSSVVEAPGLKALRRTARALVWAGQRLDQWASERALQNVCTTMPLVEFHAVADGPGGAVYVDGKLIGTLPGINRL